MYNYLFFYSAVCYQSFVDGSYADVAPQLPPAAEAETGMEKSIAPEADPELSTEQLEPSGEPQLIWLSDRYSLRESCPS